MPAHSYSSVCFKSGTSGTVIGWGATAMRGVATGRGRTYSMVDCPHARVAIQCRALLDNLRLLRPDARYSIVVLPSSLQVPHAVRGSAGSCAAVAQRGRTRVCSLVSSRARDGSLLAWLSQRKRHRSQRLEAGCPASGRRVETSQWQASDDGLLLRHAAFSARCRQRAV